MEAARRASLTNDEAHRIRAIESDAGTFSSTDVAIAGGTVDSAIADEDNNEGHQTTEVVGSGEPDPPTC